MGIKATVNKLNRLINYHVGLGGNQAHPAVNKFNSGFMTPDQKLKLENVDGQRIGMPQGTDVLTLPAGHYEISNALNNPVGPDNYSFIEYDISTSFDGRRQIEACVSSVGRRYYRSIHTGGGSDSGSGGWNYDPFIIWSGSITTGKLQYQIPMFSFMRGIRVVYSTVSGQRGSFDVYGNDSGSTVYNISNNTNDSNISLQNYEISISFDLTSLTINNNTMIIVSPNGVSEGDKNLTTITRIYAI